MYSCNIGHTLDRNATYSSRDRGLLNFQKVSSLHVFSQALPIYCHRARATSALFPAWGKIDGGFVKYLDRPMDHEERKKQNKIKLVDTLLIN